MSYTALYRKWRPSTFEDVKGQDHIVQTLKNQITSQRIGHAYLFCGTRGTGKTSIAKIFARAVNCENPVDGSPCNECPTCNGINSGASLNVVEIDAASNNGVENIRDIREQVQYPPTEGKYRVYIIDEVHMLSTGAFNALLKTLEEPPSYVIFILATTEVHKIPITVLSRCQRYDFKRITLATLTARLDELTKAEQIQVEEKALAYIARAADGSMRDALSLLDQCVAFHYGKLLTYENALEVLGAVDTSVFSKLFRAISEGDTKSCIYQLEETVVQGRELGQFVSDFIWYMRNLLLLMTAEDAENMLDMSEDNIRLMKEEAGLTHVETLMRYIRVFSDLSNQIRYAVQKRVLIELAFIRLTKPAMEENYDSILQRLQEIEDKLEDGRLFSNLAISNGTVSAGETENTGTVQGALAGGEKGTAASREPAKQVSIPKAQLDDLNLVRNEWGKIIRELGGSIRASFRNTVVEPSGESCLCIVFSSAENYAIGSRATVLGEIERFVEENYGKSIYFKSRLAGGGERFDTVYVSEEELKANIHMDITIED
ncbi:MAG: DNA polymerase III subunit gamma/tau [Lachnoclostridium edouardi]|uniref:DNA polymerase III subunit gamma/tau n=1 Tax=Lachnoclostridium edouardi TaxID=1926283 RepID=UPI0026DAA864|nr:DNA polymerase III subunit gamma/tau [Lachnoclostridium edouardi]MDO4279798.1 DNA polymerase III subunit gamma/tau [Lachnoclostridium edouardi]